MSGLLLRAVSVLSIALLLLVAGLWMATGRLIAQREAAESKAEMSEQWRLSTYELQGRLAVCQDQWVVARDETRAALALAEMEAEAAQQGQQRLDERWNARSLTCSDALDAMQAACEDEIGDY